MSEKIFREDFRKKKELSKGELAKNVGKLRVERKDKETGEKKTEEIKDYQVQDFLKNEVVKSGDTVTQVDKKLKKKFKVIEGQLKKRKEIGKTFTGKKDDEEKKATMPPTVPPITAAQSPFGVPGDEEAADDYDQRKAA
jgi:hypothetical protein